MKDNTNNTDTLAVSNKDSGGDDKLDDDDNNQVGDEDEEALEPDDEIDPSVQVSKSTTIRSCC